jgi:endonuclease III related protein
VRVSEPVGARGGEVPGRVIRRLIRTLAKAYGPRGWWPVTGKAGSPGFDARGYHPGDHASPRTPADRFEVIMGAVLTQNTAWRNAEAALRELRAAGVRTPRALLALPPGELARLVRPSGYYNQKAKKLRALAALFLAPGSLSGEHPPSREDLLAVWGVGEETADSILLYAFHRPSFVVDAYTRRLLVRLGLISGRESYGELRGLLSGSLPGEAALFSEAHALIVEHARERCRVRPLCGGCPVVVCPSHGLGLKA